MVAPYMVVMDANNPMPNLTIRTADGVAFIPCKAKTGGGYQAAVRGSVSEVALRYWHYHDVNRTLIDSYANGYAAQLLGHQAPASALYSIYDDLLRAKILSEPVAPGSMGLIETCDHRPEWAVMRDYGLSRTPWGPRFELKAASACSGMNEAGVGLDPAHRAGVPFAEPSVDFGPRADFVLGDPPFPVDPRNEWVRHFAKLAATKPDLLWDAVDELDAPMFAVINSNGSDRRSWFDCHETAHVLSDGEPRIDVVRHASQRVRRNAFERLSTFAARSDDFTYDDFVEYFDSIVHGVLLVRTTLRRRTRSPLRSSPLCVDTTRDHVRGYALRTGCPPPETTLTELSFQGVLHEQPYLRSAHRRCTDHRHHRRPFDQYHHRGRARRRSPACPGHVVRHALHVRRLGPPCGADVPGARSGPRRHAVRMDGRAWSDEPSASRMMSETHAC